MIEVDISNIWGSISLRDLLAIEKDVFQAHLELNGENCPWMALPETDGAMLAEMAEEIRDCSQVLVVLGGDGFAQGALELLGQREDLETLFVPSSFSTAIRSRVLRRLEGKPFSICLCGERRFWDTLLLRELKWILERRFGTDEANARIHEDPWGLLVLSAGGLDGKELLSGIREAAKTMDLRSYENPAWLYAAARHLLSRDNGERLIYEEPDFAGLGRWWQLLFGCGSPVTLCQRMEPPLCTGVGLDTMLRFEGVQEGLTITETAGDPGQVNFLAGRTLAQVAEVVWEGLLEADLDSGTPALVIQCAELGEGILGQLFWLFRLSAALCARLAGRDSQGLEEQLLTHLGKPQE